MGVFERAAKMLYFVAAPPPEMLRALESYQPDVVAAAKAEACKAAERGLPRAPRDWLRRVRAGEPLPALRLVDLDPQNFPPKAPEALALVLSELRPAALRELALIYLPNWGSGVLTSAAFSDLLCATRELRALEVLELERARQPRSDHLDQGPVALALGGHVFVQATFEDLVAVEQRDPATSSVAQVLLYYKGYKALAAYRLSHALWAAGRADLALAIQARVTEVFGLDIHPGAVLGGGLMIDHGTGVVIGETGASRAAHAPAPPPPSTFGLRSHAALCAAVVGRACTFLHGVTLGGTGTSADFDRHPKIGDHVFLGCGVTVLGNICVGNHCKVGAGSLVLKPLPDGATAVGSPAIIKALDARFAAAATQAAEVARLPSPDSLAGLDVASEPVTGPTEPGRDGGGSEVVQTWSGRWVPKLWHCAEAAAASA
jgi:serine acetyltransferase